MTTEYLGAYSVPDGHFGNRSVAHVCFNPENGQVIHVYSNGFHHQSVIPQAIDAAEAKWLIENHPNGKRHYR